MPPTVRRRGGGGSCRRQGARAVLLMLLASCARLAAAKECDAADQLGVAPAPCALAPSPAAWLETAEPPSTAPDTLPAGDSGGEASIAEAGGSGGGGSGSDRQQGQQQQRGLPWELLFSDEFEGPALDMGKWTYMIGQGYEFGLPGFGNGELQYYTSNPENVRQEGGQLIIEARQSDPANPYSATSGRISTIDKFSINPSGKEFGTIRVEARIQVPYGSALWPAFWMLPQIGAWEASSCIGCGYYGHWAASGEIDVMEAHGQMRTVAGSIHYGAQAPGNVREAGSLTLEAGALSDEFHLFSVEWELTQIRWYIDGAHYHTAYSSQGGTVPGGWWTAGADAGPNSPFDSPFYLILNLAVGGRTTAFTDREPLGDTLASGPKAMRVDYVRVHGLRYALSQAAAANAGGSSSGGGGGQQTQQGSDAQAAR